VHSTLNLLGFSELFLKNIEEKYKIFDEKMIKAFLFKNLKFKNQKIPFLVTGTRRKEKKFSTQSRVERVFFFESLTLPRVL